MADVKMLRELADDLDGFGRRPLESRDEVDWRERRLMQRAMAELLRYISSAATSGVSETSDEAQQARNGGSNG